jgi:hypothetical protein
VSAWLACTHEYKADPLSADSKGRDAVQYFDTAGKALSTEHAERDVRWSCGPCVNRIATTAKLPSHPDALMQGKRKPSDMKRPETLSLHAKKCAFHAEAMRHMEKERQAPDTPSHSNQLTMDSLMTPLFKLQSSYLLCVLWLVMTQSALALIRPLRDLAIALGIEMPPAMSHYTTLELLSAAAEYFRRQQRVRFALTRCHSVMGDGSTDIADHEHEVIGIRLMWNSKARVEFVELAGLDLLKSRDGESPDSQCLAACYDKTMTALGDGTTGAGA